jgi:hypothetical protein
MPRYVTFTGDQLAVAVLALGVIIGAVSVLAQELWATLMNRRDDRREAGPTLPHWPAFGGVPDELGPHVDEAMFTDPTAGGRLPDHTADELPGTESDPPIPREFDNRVRPRDYDLHFEQRPAATWLTRHGLIGRMDAPLATAGRPLRELAAERGITDGEPFVPHVPEEARRQWGRSRAGGLHFMDCPSGLTLTPLPQILSREWAREYAAEQVPPMRICATCQPIGPRPTVPQSDPFDDRRENT